MTTEAATDVLHADAVRVLQEWSAHEAGQEELRSAYLAHLAHHPDGMWRECTAGHLTASALVVDPVRERVLLTLHRKLRMWLQTGGHCESQDTALAAAALREASEESGVPGLRLLEPQGSGSGVAPVRLDRHPTPCGWHLDVQYVAIAPETAREQISEESLELRWFPYGEVASVADTSVRLLSERARALL